MGEEFRPATPRVAAGVLFRDELGRILLVRPTYKPGWDLPGGYVEPGESPKQAAAREVFEELGIRTEVGRLVVVDWAPHPDEGDKLLFVFDGGSLDLNGRTQGDGEIAEAEFFAVADAGERLSSRLFERISSAAMTPDDPYLERGQPT